MTVSLVGTPTTGVIGNTPTVFAVPAGVVNGDILLFLTATTVNGQTLTPPAAFGSAIFTNNPASLGIIAYARVASSEPASYNWSSSTGTASCSALVAFHSDLGAMSVDTVGTMGSTGVGTTIAATGITAAAAGALVAFFADASSASNTWTPPTGMTEGADFQSGSNTSKPSIEVAYLLASAVGATGSKTATASHSGDNKVGLLIQIAEPITSTGTLAAMETGSDTAAATGIVTVQGTLAVTESGADTFASTGTVLVQGTLAATETGADTFTSDGTTTLHGTFAATETGSDAFVSTGTVLVQGSLAATDAADTFASTGTVLVQGALAAVEASTDVFAATGVVKVQGALAATETGADTFTSTGDASGFDASRMMMFFA